MQSKNDFANCRRSVSSIIRALNQQSPEFAKNMKCSLVQRISERRCFVGFMQYLNFLRKYEAAVIIVDLSRLTNKNSLIQQAEIIMIRLICELNESLSISSHSEEECTEEKSLTLYEKPAGVVSPTFSRILLEKGAVSLPPTWIKKFEPNVTQDPMTIRKYLDEKVKIRKGGPLKDKGPTLFKSSNLSKTVKQELQLFDSTEHRSSNVINLVFHFIDGKCLCLPVHDDDLLATWHLIQRFSAKTEAKLRLISVGTSSDNSFFHSPEAGVFWKVVSHHRFKSNDERSRTTTVSCSRKLKTKVSV
ncbi:hypothetical protein AVEN_109352-1 [Araneus ventricosus]|uniref:Uncharacterized protein n=1 Tax=Araneus ventricosus TaxID=182803 RepID=A0A4Y2GKY3_ARAVE|nr:hypothetical protein AVEN_109352-1 [Araneus ventricosus]